MRYAESVPPLSSRGIQISASELSTLADIVLRTSGHEIAQRADFVRTRLEPRLEATACSSFRDYIERVDRDAVERQRMVEALCTHETRFFRESPHFARLRTLADARVRAADATGAPRRIRVWTAACSTGEEAYSIAMVLVDALPATDGWRVEVLATDLSNAALEAARAARYAPELAADIPEAYRRKFVVRASSGGAFTFAADVLRAVTFAPVNLIERDLPVSGAFDAIFCRNVLFYFPRPVRKHVLASLASHLRPDGLLFLGHADSSLEMEGSAFVAPGVYRPGSPDR